MSLTRFANRLNIQLGKSHPHVIVNVVGYPNRSTARREMFATG
jgi:hypothetical protein